MRDHACLGSGSSEAAGLRACRPTEHRGYCANDAAVTPTGNARTEGQYFLGAKELTLALCAS